MTLPPDPVDPREAGMILKKARNKLGLTQGQVIEAVGIPNQSYLSALENGRYNVANSEYLPALAQLLRLSLEDIRTINPSAVITVAAPEPAAFDPRTLFHPQAQRRREKRSLWPNLAQMVEEKQEKHPPLRETRWQQHLNQTRFSGGQEPDAEGWFEMYQTLRRNNVEPEAWPDED